MQCDRSVQFLEYRYSIDVVQCVAVCCSELQCVSVSCSVLQCVAVCCSELQCAREVQSRSNAFQILRCDVLKKDAVRYRVVQRVAVCCSGLQCGTVFCSVLQGAAV